MCKSHENMTASVVILCLVLSLYFISDVVNKVSMCGKNIKYVMGQLFLLFISKE